MKISVDKQVIEQALEALDESLQLLLPKEQSDKCRRANFVLRTVLEQQQEQEPVAWGCSVCGGTPLLCLHGQKDTPFYTTPPRREWVSLTEEEIQTIVNKVATGTYQTSDTFARAIEQALKEKNHE